jgi:hypothetical protein
VYSLETVQSVVALYLLDPSSTITILTNGLQGTSIMLHIGVIADYYHPSLCRFENIGVFWRIFCSTLRLKF